MRLLGAAGFMLSAALAGAEVINTTIHYTTNPANGQWTLWPGSSSTCEVLSNTGRDEVNEKYIIEAKLPATCPYMYFRTPFAHALDGTSALEAKIEVEAASGSLLYDATVRLGYGIDIPGFGIYGNTVGSFSYDTTSAGVQSVGGEYTSFISNIITTTQDGFMLSEPGDLLAKSTGPVIFVKNITVGSATPRAVTLTITIDDLHVQHDGSALDSSYETAMTNAAIAYSNRIDAIRTALNTDIGVAKSAIDGLSLSGHPALAAAMSAEAAEIEDYHEIFRPARDTPRQLEDYLDHAAARSRSLGTVRPRQRSGRAARSLRTAPADSERAGGGVGSICGG
jgi:hypothetical protein